MNRGFTLVELLISIAIFAIMTALVVTRYGAFNQGALLTNLAYDIALSIRTAQTYGLSVRSAGSNFTNSYGVDFVKNNDSFVLFADTNPNNIYTSSLDELVSTYTLKRGATIYDICVVSGTGPCSPANQLDILFKRPSPTAIICVPAAPSTTCNYAEAKVTIRGTDGSTRTVDILSNGQISVLD